MFRVRVSVRVVAALALTVVSGRGSGDLWIYFLGEFLGGIAAAGVFVFWIIDPETRQVRGKVVARRVNASDDVGDTKRPFLADSDVNYS